jgi:hypothetical protein
MRWTAWFASVFLIACSRTAPPPPAVSCVERPGCSIRPIAADDPQDADPLQQQLGCGPELVYMNGATKGIHGGRGSFCPDSPSNRKALHDAGKRGYLPGHCEVCLGVPASWIFVFWAETEGPGCPSGCVEGFSAPLL